MDRYRANSRPCCERPQQRQAPQQHQTPQCGAASMYSHVDHMVPAMAYVPMQKWEGTFDLCRGFQMGTLFPNLCMPFCGRGKRGGCR